MKFPIITSERWHTETYGNPEECYKEYLEINKDDRRLLELLSGDFKELSAARNKHYVDKWSSIAGQFPFKDSSVILDLGSIGVMDEIILTNFKKVKKIVCIDGNKKAIEMVKPHLRPQIKPLYCNFYNDKLPELEPEFDTVLQIDFPEHLPDKLWGEVTEWSYNLLKPEGQMFLFCPVYPYASDQIEHISVKSYGYIVNLLSKKLNMKIRINETHLETRIFMIAKKGDK